MRPVDGQLEGPTHTPQPWQKSKPRRAGKRLLTILHRQHFVFLLFYRDTHRHIFPKSISAGKEAVVTADKFHSLLYKHFGRTRGSSSSVCAARLKFISGQQ